MSGLQGLFFLEDLVDQMQLQSFLGLKFFGEDDHISHGAGEVVSFLDDCHHAGRKVHLKLCLLCAELCFAGYIDVIMGKG